MNTQVATVLYLQAKRKYLFPRDVTTGPLIRKYLCVQRPLAMQCLKKGIIVQGLLPCRMLGARAPLAIGAIGLRHG